MTVKYAELKTDHQKGVYAAFSSVAENKDKPKNKDTPEQMGAFVNSRGINADVDDAVTTLAKRYKLEDIKLFQGKHWNDGTFELEESSENVITYNAMAALVADFEKLRTDIASSGEIDTLKGNYHIEIEHAIYCRTKKGSRDIEVWEETPKTYNAKKQPVKMADVKFPDRGVLVVYSRRRLDVAAKPHVPVKYEGIKEPQKSVYQAFTQVTGNKDTPEQMGVYVNSLDLDADDNAAVRALAEKCWLKAEAQMFLGKSLLDKTFKRGNGSEYVLTISDNKSMIAAFGKLGKPVVTGQAVTELHDKFKNLLGRGVYCKTQKDSDEIEVWGDKKQKPLEGVDKDHLVVAYGRVQPKPAPKPAPAPKVGEGK